MKAWVWIWLAIVALLVAVLVHRLQSRSDEEAWRRLNSEAEALYDKGRCEDAEPRAEKALKAATRHFGENHRNAAVCMRTLGRIRLELGKYFEALALLKRSLQILESAQGEDGDLFVKLLY